MSTLRRVEHPGTPAATPAASPGRPGATVHRTGDRDDGGEPVVELRVCGPGRLERSYRTRIDGLEQKLTVARLVERGTDRLVDRIETDLERERTRADEAHGQGRRLLVALGAVQRDNERLQDELTRARATLARLEAPRPGLLARLLDPLLGRTRS